MNIDSWKSQLRKGAAELAVLSLIKRQPASGTAILDLLSSYPEVGLSDGSIYPLLNRLEREGRISGTWAAPKGGGRGQKTYTITAEGKAALNEMKAVWDGFRKQLSSITGDAND